MAKASWHPVTDYVLAEAATTNRSAAKAQDEAEALRAAGRTGVEVWRCGDRFEARADPAPYLETEQGPR